MTNWNNAYTTKTVETIVEHGDIIRLRYKEAFKEGNNPVTALAFSAWYLRRQAAEGRGLLHPQTVWIDYAGAIALTLAAFAAWCNAD